MVDNEIKPTTPEIEEELDRILSSKVFATAQRSQAFFRYVVERSLTDAPPPLKEFSIAMDVFARGDDYDPSIDATVRVEAGRLRSRLREYYDVEGSGDPVAIDVPKGGIVRLLPFATARLARQKKRRRWWSRPGRLRSCRGGRLCSGVAGRLLVWCCSGWLLRACGDGTRRGSRYE